MDYVHPVEKGDDYVDEPLRDLDKVLTNAAEVRFTLDYPFERPFAGLITKPITLRRLVDGIRAGFRKMYAGATEREIPGMMNKDVQGLYGRSFHSMATSSSSRSS